jgi:cytochrome c oxidase assembly protein subunit 15
MARSNDNVWLHRFACVAALATLGLIALGGLVTSHGAGMSVPDWPTSNGYNMFFFPISQWVGGIFYEHTHRLAASAVGFVTVILAVWLWLKEPRAWVRRLGVLAVFLVVLQGVLGGLRVVLLKDEIGIFHAALAQSFFVLLCALVLFTSRWWRKLPIAFPVAPDRGGLRGLITFGSALIFAQLVLGAAMRHQHAGLAIPDFPLAYHKLWPALDPASVAGYNQTRLEAAGENPITAAQIVLQLVHRFMAALILCALIVIARTARRQLGARHPVSRAALLWLGLVCLQAVLGAFTIWSNKAADVATAHVVVGALSLVAGVLLDLVAFRVLASFPMTAAARPVTDPAGSRLPAPNNG